MEMEKVIEQIYASDQISITRFYKGQMIEDGISINVVRIDQYGNNIVVFGNNNDEILLEGEISYDEELGYVFTNGELITYIAA